MLTPIVSGIVVRRPTFSDEDTGERERADALVFRRHVHRSDRPGVRSVLLEHVALAVRRFEVDSTVAGPPAESPLSRCVAVGYQRRD